MVRKTCATMTTNASQLLAATIAVVKTTGCKTSRCPLRRGEPVRFAFRNERPCLRKRMHQMLLADCETRELNFVGDRRYPLQTLAGDFRQTNFAGCIGQKLARRFWERRHVEF